MRKALIAFLFALVLAPLARAQSTIPVTTVTQLGTGDCLAYPTRGNTCIINDGVTTLDCSVGGGSLVTLCMWDGTIWRPVYDGNNQPLGVMEIAAEGRRGGAFGPVATRESYFCGGLPNNGTNYAPPQTGYGLAPALGGALALTLGGLTCSLADNTTEASADAVMYSNVEMVAQQLYCRVTGAGSNGVTFTLRRGGSDTAPAVSCTVPNGSLDCASPFSSVGVVPANTAVSVRAVTTENLSAQGYACTLLFSLR